MPLAVAIQMDPIEGIDIDADSTFVLALEAQRRGHDLLYYHPKDLALVGDRAVTRARPLEVRRERGNHFTLGPMRDVDLAGVDVVLMRQDPPFDLAYISATHILEHIHPETLVVNDPNHVRNAPEKLLMTWFPEIIPPTLITRDKRRILEFRAEHRDIILKPLYGNGGFGVFRIHPEDENLNALIEMFADVSPEPLVAQAYIPEVRTRGDKRIILVDGEPKGVIARLPQAGEARSNMHVGGTAMKEVLNARDRDICAAIGPTLKERGLIFAGIDVIGPYLTEINVTSPTGIQEIDRFDGTCLEADIWDAIEARLKAR